jgi:hypothetical protein
MPPGPAPEPTEGPAILPRTGDHEAPDPVILAPARGPPPRRGSCRSLGTDPPPIGASPGLRLLPRIRIVNPLPTDLVVASKNGMRRPASPTGIP